jgi:hypothetical protein
MRFLVLRPSLSCPSDGGAHARDTQLHSSGCTTGGSHDLNYLPWGNAITAFRPSIEGEGNAWIGRPEPGESAGGALPSDGEEPAIQFRTCYLVGSADTASRFVHYREKRPYRSTRPAQREKQEVEAGRHRGLAPSVRIGHMFLISDR